MRMRNEHFCPSAIYITGTCANILLAQTQLQILVTVTQRATNVPQTNNTSTSGMNEE